MQVNDPVCGTKLALDRAAGQEDHRGWAYFFCSTRCDRLFTADPARYVGGEQPFARPLASEAHEEQGSHG